MLSKIRTNERGVRLRKRVKGSAGEWRAEMELITTTLKVPKWLKQWVDRQPESFGLMFERAAIEYFGAEPPGQVKKCLMRRKRADEKRIAIRVAVLDKLVDIEKFKLL